MLYLGIHSGYEVGDIAEKYNMTKLYANTILFGLKTRNFDTTNSTASTILHCHRIHPI